MAGAGGALPCNGDCAGTTPVCDVASDSCVQCLGVTDCQAPKPACDLASHTCVECASNTDCKPPRPACDLASNRCVECLTNAECSFQKPVCDTGNTCAECTANSDCKDSAKPFCDQATESCVTCLKQADCMAPAASACSAGQCKPCTLDAECSTIIGKGVCDAGACVQCTGKKFEACGQNAGTPLVCDSLKRTCTMNKQRSAGLCKACVSDAQCNAGQMCVFDKFGNPSKDVGYFCHWKKGDVADGAPLNCSVTGMPYVGTQLGAMSVDGVTSDICTLATSTCTALNQFRSKDCTVAAAPSDALCGISPPKDAKCGLYDAGAGTYRCTMACLSDDDCPSPSTCNTGVSPFVCNLN